MTVVYIAREGRSYCGHCEEELPEEWYSKEYSKAIIARPSGMLVIAVERPIHKCASMTHEDFISALRAAGSLLRTL